MILPSKKIVSIFILVAALVGSIIITFGRDKSGAVINKVSNLGAGEKVSIPENPNWQNELNNINLGVVATTTKGASSENETVTDAVSRSLISNYLALKQTGTLDSTSAQKLMDQSISYIEQTGKQSIQTSQLNVVSDNGKQSITSYGENLGTIARNKSQAEIKEEMTLIVQIMQSQDKSKLNKLDSIIADYKNIVTKLLKMPVPKTFVKAHIDIVNGTNGMALALKSIKDISNDPIKGLSAVQSYQTSLTTLAEATNAVVKFIKQNNIVYKQGSGGYYLLYGI